MYPDLLEIFGVTLHGPVFEHILFSIGALMMVWGGVSSVQIFRAGKKTEALVQGAIVLALLIWFVKGALAALEPGYALIFKEPLVVHSYAFCILIGIVLGTLTARKIAKIRNDEPDEIGWLCVMMVVFGFLGARAAHVIVDNETYINACFHPELTASGERDCLRVLNFAEGGLTFYGGVIAGMFVVASFFFRRFRKKRPLMGLSVLDMLAAALAVAHAFGRIGCIAAGCCWGAITTGSVGFHYKAGTFAYSELMKIPELREGMMATGETPLLHATQVYEAGSEFLLYGLLWWMLRKGVKPGQMVGTWFAGYGVIRFIVEFMRDDSERGYYFEQVIDPINAFFKVVPGHPTILSTSQGIAMGMILIGIVLLILSRVMSKRVADSEAEVKSEVSAESELGADGKTEAVSAESVVEQELSDAEALEVQEASEPSSAEGEEESGSGEKSGGKPEEG